MKTHLYYITTIVALIILGAFFYNKWQDSNAEVRRKDSVIAEKNAEIKFRTNRQGQIVAEKEAAILRAKEIEDSYPAIAEKLEKSFDIKVKNLKAYIENQFHARGEGTAPIITNNYYDTATNRMVTAHKVDINDGYLDFHSVQFDSLKQVFYEYMYTDTASTAIHGKKKWLFGNEKLYATTIFNNPNAAITGTTNILVDSYKDKRWVISAGVSYVPFGEQHFQPTISVGYAIFKF